MHAVMQWFSMNYASSNAFLVLQICTSSSAACSNSSSWSVNLEHHAVMLILVLVVLLVLTCTHVLVLMCVEARIVAKHVLNLPPSWLLQLAKALPGRHNVLFSALHP
ncbi:TPA: hypothetical protein ACH3X1_014736 [Trebouxia sp. C0004]